MLHVKNKEIKINTRKDSFYLYRWRIAEFAIIVTAFILYSFWAFHLPSGLAPDEAMRFDVPYYIYYFDELPLGDEPLIRNPVWGFSYAYSVYGSSLFAIPLMKFVGIFTTNPTELLIAARFVNVIFATSTLFICFRIADIVFPADYLSRTFFAFFVGFLPQYYFLASYFNSDAMSIMSVAFVLYAILYCKKTGWHRIGLILLGVAIGLVALSYYYAYGAIIAAIIFYFWDAASDTRRRNVKNLILKPLLIFFVSFLLSGCFFVRNFLIYDGDIFGIHASNLACQINAIEELKPENRITPKDLGYSPFQLVFGMWQSKENWLTVAMESSIGRFGYMDIALPSYIILLYQVIILGGIVFAIIAFAVMSKNEKIRLLPFIVAIFIMILTPWLLSLYYSWSSDYQSQGRYIISGLVPLALVVTWGYKQYASKMFSSNCKNSFEPKPNLAHTSSNKSSSIVQKTSHQYRVFYYCIIIGWIGLFLIVFFHVIIPQCTGGVGEITPLLLINLGLS